MHAAPPIQSGEGEETAETIAMTVKGSAALIVKRKPATPAAAASEAVLDMANSPCRRESSRSAAP